MKKILTLLILFVTVIGNIYAGSSENPKITATLGVRYFDGENYTTGGGKIYYCGSQSKSSDFLSSGNTTDNITTEYKNPIEQSLTTATNNYQIIYAKANEGNYFVCWASNENNIGSQSGLSNWWSATDSIICLGGSQLLGNTGSFERYAMFKPSACYYNILEAEVVFVDAKGEIIEGYSPDIAQYQVKIGNGDWGYSVTSNNPRLVSCGKQFPGKFGGHTYEVKSPSDDKAYEFVGWFKDIENSSIYENGNINQNKQLVDTDNDNNSKTCKLAEQETSDLYNDFKTTPTQAPRVPKVYAVFKASSIALYKYNAVIDKFNEAMPPVENDEGEWVKYVDVPYATNETLYKLEHTFGEQLKIESNSDFVGTLDKVQGLDVLRVNPISEGDLSGVITFVVGETPIAKLHLSAMSDNNYPSITLKPAADLLGIYTYTQQSTGSQEFTVTTSEVLKLLIKETDKMFTFKATPTDPNKAEFVKWVIEIPAEDNNEDTRYIEDTRSTFSYRFKGGESIMPVFRSTEYATFIIKSRPEIKYYDLQEALDAAADMDNPQEQVVTVYAPTATSVRLKYKPEGYKIKDGVTFLIPGDATYTTRIGDLQDDVDCVTASGYGSAPAMTTHCKLIVDDNTNITVENGNISVYSRILVVQRNNGGRLNHGWLKLGKNCNITVKKDGGGLYAFGFITGDKSSSITMEERTTTYEIFHFLDWRGGVETYSMRTSGVFPIGQYYIQSIEIPLTLKYEAKHYVSTAIDVTAGSIYPVNMKLVDTYAADYCLFGLGEGTTLTKTYDTSKDRIRFEINGTGAGTSKLKIGHIKLDLLVNLPLVGDQSLILDSKNFVLPIQNNMDIVVNNTTIDVTSDIAFMPSSTLHLRKDAVLNIENIDPSSNDIIDVFVYSSNASRINVPNEGYWGHNNTPGAIMWSSANAGHTIRKKERPDGNVTRVNDYADATLIIDGIVNIKEKGALYTVNGDYKEGVYGANITSNGGGKIYVNNIGTLSNTYQWYRTDPGNSSSGTKYSIPLTEPNLLLHNDISKQVCPNPEEPDACKIKYTSANKKGGVYTYYQNDGMWREDEEKLPISGIKLYDSNDKEINQFYVTMPTPTTINGYVLASLEKLTGVTYNEDASDFSIALESGNITLNSNPTVEGDKLKIPVTYNVQNVHGSTTQTLTITNTNSAAFTCNFSAPVKAQENYTPVFSVPSTVNIYARVGEPTYAASPILCKSDNVVTLTKSDNSGDLKWTATFTHKEGNTTITNRDFEFVLGSEGQELSGARIKYTPSDDTRRTVTLTLKATYKDGGSKNITCCEQNKDIAEHKVTINTYPSVVANTMEFNEVGTLLPGKEFELLRFVNSDVKPQLFINDTEVTGDSFGDNVISVGYNGGDASLSKPNYSVTVNGPGTVKVRVHQEAYNGIEAKTIEKTFVVTSNPPAIDEGICVSGNDASTIFNRLTSAVENEVQCSEGCITFAKSASWTAQFEGVAGNISFTPSGDGYWAVEESQGHGYNWEQTSIYWTKLTPGQPIVVNLQPKTRLIKISYSDNNPETENGGSITDFCINPLSIYAEIDHLYIPIREGVVDPIFIDFTHSTPLPESAFAINKPDNWIQKVIARTKNDEDNGNLNWGGDLNVYYKTRVELSPKEEVSISEAKNVVAVTATKSQTESATVNVSTYNFPKPLPIYATTWTQEATDDNGYKKSEYYYHYMVESSYVKWDEANQDVIFLNKGNDTGAKRQVVFGFDGMPDEVRFQSISGEWLVEESVNGTTWPAGSPTTSNVSTKTVGETQYWYKEISQTTKYVRITYLGEAMDEIVLNDLVIEGFPTAVARESDQIDSPEVTEIILPDANSNKTATFYIHVKNLDNLQLAMENSSGFTFKHGSADSNNATQFTFTDGKINFDVNDYNFLAVNQAGFIPVIVTWNAQHIVDEGYLRIQKPSANPEEPAQDLHVIHIVAKKDVVTQSDSKTGIWTGVPDGKTSGRPTALSYELRGLNVTYDPYSYHEVNVANAFDKTGKALFDYLVIYGETTTKDGSRIIYEADGSRGSNALTPYYIYERINETSYQLRQSVENANSPTKAVLDQVSHHVGIEGENEQMYYAIQPNDNDSVSFYMTGFCPYATTGSTMHDEGVWYFRGKEGSKVNIYLEDCHIYSRNKTVIGHKVGKYDEGVVEYTADDGVVKGSGAVLVFEHMSGETKPAIPFNVAIHTIGHNVFKSNYGAYLNVLGVGNVRAAQVSASVQVRLSHMKDSTTAYTNIDFDDKWPDVYDYSTKKITSIKRTNGFLSLQKQHNHAPSIDLGNRNTVVNFRGGQVELQNATVVSPNYKTTLAISHRSGLMGNIKDFNFSLGLGTDDVGGTVNFYDGTTTVKPMTVAEAYRDFYLMDEDDPTRTSCLRTPTNTFIYGGSHCMMRACKYVTSSGGAPKDRPGGNFLGLYKYPSAPWSETVDGKTVTHKGGWTEIVGGNGLVTIPLENLPNANYGTESITPNTNSTANDKSDDYLNFWVPEGYDDSVIIEEDKLLTAWKASMTRIEAGFMEVNAGVGGVVSVNPDERITNLLYCQLDEYIHEVISEGCSDGECVYMAPVKDPTNGMLELEEPYVYIAPSHVGDSLQHSIVSEIDYEVTNKVYYVTTAKADTWMNFTLPFDVEKVHVVEAYREEEIEDYFNSLDEEEYDRMYETLRFQAKHNADFAAFFGMAMAMGDYAATFDDIYNDYTDWGLYVDSEPVKGEEDDGDANDDTPTREYYTGDAKNYDWRGMRQLTHYDGTNFSTSNYYLYKNNGDWTKFTDAKGKERFAVQWEVVPKVAPGETLMHKGETYSLLFPYCQGCDGWIEENPETGKWEVKVDDDGYPVLKERKYWDYWSGKFIIFESTGATVNDPHEIRGSNYNEASKVENSPWIFDNVTDLAAQAVLSGNSTFHMMDLNQYTAYKGNIYEYSSVRGLEQYKSLIDQFNTTYSTIAPTNTFLLTNHSKPIRSIARDGRIVTDGDSSGNQGTTTGGNIPTVGGGHSMFITGVDGGINVAVSNPQQVRVISATGTILYSGYVNDNVDIPLPINGIYIVKGETEVQKIFY